MRLCCQERHQLAEEFAITARLFAEAVILLTTGAHDGHKDLESLHVAVLDAQQRAEQAHILEEHVRLHHCTDLAAPDGLTESTAGKKAAHKYVQNSRDGPQNGDNRERV